MHFCWKDRQKGTIEDDLIIFPDDVEYKPVPQCTTGRVYVLKFKSNQRKMFFWLQEPKTDKDEDICRKLNDFLNNPPAPGSSHGGGSSLASLPAELAGLGGESDLQSILGSMNQQQLMQLISGMGGMRGMSSLIDGSASSSLLSDSTVPSRVQSAQGTRSVTSTDAQPPERPATAAAVPSHGTGGTRVTASQPVQPEAAPRIRMEDFQSILSGLSAMDSGVPREIDLSQSIDPETIIPILANPEVQQRLVPFLPEGEEIPKTEQELRETVHSAQFRQALQSFSAAMASCQLGPLMAQFGLNDEAVQAAILGDVAAFALALQNAAKKSDDNEPTDMDEGK